MKKILDFLRGVKNRVLEYFGKGLHYGVVVPVGFVTNKIGNFFEDNPLGKRIKNTYYLSYNIVNKGPISRAISRIAFAAGVGALALINPYVALGAVMLGFMGYSSNAFLTGAMRALTTYIEMGIGLYLFLMLIVLSAPQGPVVILQMAGFAAAYMFLKRVRRYTLSDVIDAEEFKALKAEMMAGKNTSTYFSNSEDQVEEEPKVEVAAPVLGGV